MTLRKQVHYVLPTVQVLLVLVVPKEEEGKSSVRTDFSKARYIGQNAFRTFAEKSGKVNLYTTIVYIQRCCKVRSPL